MDLHTHEWLLSDSRIILLSRTKIWKRMESGATRLNLGLGVLFIHPDIH